MIVSCNVLVNAVSVLRFPVRDIETFTKFVPPTDVVVCVKVNALMLVSVPSVRSCQSVQAVVVLAQVWSVPLVVFNW